MRSRVVRTLIAVLIVACNYSRLACAVTLRKATSGSYSAKNASNSSNASSRSWYEIWGKEAGPPPLPHRQWQLKAEESDWHKKQQIMRAERMAPSTAYSRELADRTSSGVGRGGDDADSVLWRRHDPIDDNSAFWISFCNATAEARSTAEGRKNASKTIQAEAANLTKSVEKLTETAEAAAKEAKAAMSSLAKKSTALAEAEHKLAGTPADVALSKAKDDAFAAVAAARGEVNQKAATLETADEALAKEKAKALCSSTDGSGTSAAYPCFCGRTRGPVCARFEICTVSEADSGESTCALRRPLDHYEVSLNTTCPKGQLVHAGKMIESELDAYELCGAGCSAVVDVGCERKKFRLCKMGAMVEEDKAPPPDCLRKRVPNHPPPTGVSRPPLHLDLWKEFCARKVEKQIAFRLLFSRRLCASGKEIGDAHTEALCAEKTKADSECSQVFDFQSSKGAPNVCRCVKKSEQCNAAAPDGPGVEGQNVWLLE
eukprot:TRINITY_DN75014_c0_g1_i1.p1 TRINITY_DN75014_c0_g1~~TRINITY_DN75014_c0_g1_i1.p1  ORF type:complete len:488 (-),score=76.41 TRINITY_DN75014_c0_g1_i1:338-1801(-)